MYISIASIFKTTLFRSSAHIPLIYIRCLLSVCLPVSDGFTGSRAERITTGDATDSRHITTGNVYRNFSVSMPCLFLFYFIFNLMSIIYLIIYFINYKINDIISNTDNRLAMISLVIEVYVIVCQSPMCTILSGPICNPSILSLYHSHSLFL